MVKTGSETGNRPPDVRRGDQAAIRIRNEFASVEVEKDSSANGERLLIRDLRTGIFVYLDALELEAITRLSHVDFACLLDPGFAGLQVGPPA